MVKNLITAGAAAAMLLMAAVPTFAHTRRPPAPKPDVNVGSVEDNNVVAVANSGLNDQEGGKIQLMETGDATAWARQDNLVNSGCGCDEKGTTINKGEVEDNNVVAIANSGLNEQEGSRHSHGFSVQAMKTGKAYADAYQFNVVNSSVEVK